MIRVLMNKNVFSKLKMIATDAVEDFKSLKYIYLSLLGIGAVGVLIVLALEYNN